jgi:hypothetical protein
MFQTQHTLNMTSLITVVGDKVLREWLKPIEFTELEYHAFRMFIGSLIQISTAPEGRIRVTYKQPEMEQITTFFSQLNLSRLNKTRLEPSPPPFKITAETFLSTKIWTIEEVKNIFICGHNDALPRDADPDAHPSGGGGSGGPGCA